MDHAGQFLPQLQGNFLTQSSQKLHFALLNNVPAISTLQVYITALPQIERSWKIFSIIKSDIGSLQFMNRFL
jgi:hypothetical protein